MAATPRLDFALDTYECIVLYPGPSGRALPDETVQRFQAEHIRAHPGAATAGHRPGRRLGGRAGPRAGPADRLRPGPHRLASTTCAA